MPTCFVIQPFDGSKYDKRFEDVYSPAIKAAGLEPYRVDKDPSVEMPIEAIEDGIRASAACLADITEDNPNVWYELGFAFASGKPVVMVCASDREKYPFDIQHRTIIPYTADSPRDFDVLKTSITNRIKAVLTRTEALRAVGGAEQVAPVHGLTQPELAVLACLAGSVLLQEEGAAAYSIKNEVERAGFTPIGFSVGVKRLRAKSLIDVREASDWNNRGEAYQEIVITSQGWDWIEQNEDKFLIHRPAEQNDEPDLPIW